MFKNIRKIAIGTPSFLAISISLAMSANAAEDATTLESIVVVGETTNTEITPEELERQQAVDLEDIFRSIPSVSVGGSIEMAQKVYIRGLEDTLLNVTVDGAPQTGTQFHHTGRITVEPELLKSVEVQQGAGEATSGAGALGGAIRFETKNAEDLLIEGKTFGGLLKGSYSSNDEGYRISTSLFGKLNDNWGILTSYVTSDSDNFEDGDGDEVEGSASDQDLIFVKVNGDITENQEISFSAEQRKESGEFAQRPNWEVNVDDFPFNQLEDLDRVRQTFTLNHTYNPNDLIDLKTTIYTTETELVQDVQNWRLRGIGWGEFTGITESTGIDIKNTSKLGKHSLTYGLDYRKDKVESSYADEATAIDWGFVYPDDIPVNSSFREEGTVIGLYLQDHWQLSDKLLLSYGVRYDNYDLEQITFNNSTDSDGFSPNIGFSYDFNDNLKLTAGHAHALRGKEIGDAFTLEHDPTLISLDPDLEAETVQNSEIGIEFDKDNYGIKASIYRTTIDDVIQDQLGTDSANEESSVYYENIGKLESTGFEVGGYYEWDRLKLEANFSHNDPELNGNTVEGYEHLAIGNVRGDSLNINASYDISPQLELGWNFTHVGSVNNIDVLQYSVTVDADIQSVETIDKPGYNVHDLNLRWKPAAVKNLIVDFAVQNVFDETYLDHSSVADYTDIEFFGLIRGVNERGRDYRVSVQYKF